MTTWQLIREMVQKGYEFQTGRHTKGLSGYFAVFFKDDDESRPECDECSERPDPSWRDCGHAMTPHRAVVMAARKTLGLTVVIPGSEDFKL